MAAVAHPYRSAHTAHLAGLPDRMHPLRTHHADALPNPPSAKPRAFPLAGPVKSRPIYAGPASEFASPLDLDATSEFRDCANAALLASVNPPLGTMHPAPLFSSPPWSAERNIGATMRDTKTAVGVARTDGENSVEGSTANALASGPCSNAVSTSLHASLDVRRSVCQSPTWEAYTQRKQDKKGAKKEKEQAAKQAKSKSRRLSKPPPPSTTLAPQLGRRTQSEQNISKTGASALFSKDSPQSTASLGLIDPPPIGSSSRKSRSRSSSFSSLIKSTFELRRPSVDSTFDNGFIGGIKLEQHRVAAEEEQRKEEDRLAKEDELGIHPALRSQESHRRAGPAATGPPTSTRSRYPPSTWRTSPSTASLISSNTTPQLPDLSTINKWRTRVGLKTKPDDAATSSPTAEHQSNSPGGVIYSSGTPTSPARHSLDSARRFFRGDEPAFELPDFRDFSGQTPSPPPPEPPQKSPKRKSFVSMESPISPKPNWGRLETADKNPNAYANVSPGAAPRRASIDGSIPEPIVSNIHKRSFKEAARAAFGKSPMRPGTANSQSKPATNRSASASTFTPQQPHSLRRAQTSSSEGSLSDEYHSSGSGTTNVTTPNTSRPQSARGMFTMAPKMGLSSERKKNIGQRSEKPPGPAPVARGAMEDELDPIQAAAQKVRAAFPEGGVNAKGADRRPQSAASSQRDVPRLRHPTLRPEDRSRTKLPLNLEFSDDDDRSPEVRELILSKDQSSVAAPWPASYLEAARKAAPAAPVPRNKPTNFPSPSLSSNGGLAPPSPRSQILSSAGSIDSRGQSPVRTSASSLYGPSTVQTANSSEEGREPLAKMFVECCGCRYYHDMPSKLYEAMSNPDGALGGPGEFAHSSVVSMTVRCPWCQHEMSTKCCAGLAAMVYVKERLH